MVFGRLLGQPAKTGGIPRQMDPGDAAAHIERLESAFSQISSVFTGRRNLNTVLEHVVRESLTCLRANRSTLFLHDPNSEVLKAQFTHVLEPRYQQVGVAEEKEMAKKSLRQGKPLLLAGPESFSDFFKYEERENKITSLMSVPLFVRGKAMGILSGLLINERYNFDGKSLRFFSSFANLASTAIELVQLQDEAKRGNDFRITYERYLDNILAQTQSLSDREQERIQDHISTIQAERKAEDREFLESQADERVPWAPGAILIKDEPGIERRKDERIEVMVRVEFDEEYCCFTGDLSRGGAFVLTQNPMDLGEEFDLKIHIPDGREPVEVGCKAIWTNKYGKESKGLRRGMGVKFLKLQPPDQIRIEEFIKAYKPEKISPKMIDKDGG
jgi:Tfp pilus assembly protein PilZ